MSTTLKEQLVADRARMRRLLKEQPDWSYRQLSEATQRSISWVKDWKKRLKVAPPQDEVVLWGKTPRPHTPPPPPPPLLLERLLELRNNPPQDLKRVPGPKTLSYFLQRDPVLKQAGIVPPRSTSTIYKLLVRLGCYDRPGLKKAQPLERVAPLESIAIDFKDVTSIELDPGGKQAHLVEVLNFVDEGTSLLWAAVARQDFNAQTVLATLLEVFEQQGLPRQLRFDRDPRFVGASQGRDFPSALVRMLYVLAIQVAICPPRHPQKNPYVERYNRNFKYECLVVHRPESLGRVREVTAQYKEHYNYVRPHQGRSCHNQPPRVAFAELPALPSLPLVVDPDSWLTKLHHDHFRRKVQHDGSVVLDKYTYYVGSALAGQYVMLVVEASTREVVVLHQQKEVKRLALKGLYRRGMGLDEYRTAILAEALSEQRGWRPMVESTNATSPVAPATPRPV